MLLNSVSTPSSFTGTGMLLRAQFCHCTIRESPLRLVTEPPLGVPVSVWITPQSSRYRLSGWHNCTTRRGDTHDVKFLLLYWPCLELPKKRSNNLVKEKWRVIIQNTDGINSACKRTTPKLSVHNKRLQREFQSLNSPVLSKRSSLASSSSICST